jgi:hypothetical protein
MPRKKPPRLEEESILASARTAIIAVGGGRGFVVETNAQERFVITAAQCLPDLPRVPASHSRQRTYPSLLAPLDRGKAAVAAECLFIDPIADVAVLGGPDTQLLSQEAAAFAAFIAARAALPVTRTPIRTQRSTRGWLMTRAGEWKQCVLTGCGHPQQTALTIAVDGAARRYAPGMSGSPILDHAGHVVGVVSVGATLNPALPTRLPLAVLHRIIAL